MKIVAMFSLLGMLYSPDAGFDRRATIPVGDHTFNAEVCRAADWWNRAAGRRLLMCFPDQSSGNYPGEIEVVDARAHEVPCFACAAPVRTDGRYEYPPAYPYGRCVVYVAGRPSWSLVAHELGHCLGFDHGSVRGSVMNSQVVARPSLMQARGLLREAGYL